MLALLIFLLIGCRPQISFFDPADSQLCVKLGIDEKDYDAIRQLCAEENGLVMMDVGRAGENVIEVEFKTLGDDRPVQGGPIKRYEKVNGVWMEDGNFTGSWIGN